MGGLVSSLKEMLGIEKPKYFEYPKNFFLETFKQNAIKRNNLNNPDNQNKLIIKCLQVSDYLMSSKKRIINKNQFGSGIFNKKPPVKKQLFIFCCENTFEAITTLYFSWIRKINPNLPILILGLEGFLEDTQQTKKWNDFILDNKRIREIRRLVYNPSDFPLKKIALRFLYHHLKPTITDTEILQYYVETQQIKLSNYNEAKIVFVKHFTGNNECELLDRSNNPIFPRNWLDSNYWINSSTLNIELRQRFKTTNNLLVDGLFLPDLDILMKETDLDKLKKLEGYLRFVIIQYSINLKNSLKNKKPFNRLKLPPTFFINYKKMREILKQKIIEKRNSLKKTEQKLL
jgi:hypothetical protein